MEQRRDNGSQIVIAPPQGQQQPPQGQPRASTADIELDGFQFKIPVIVLPSKVIGAPPTVIPQDLSFLNLFFLASVGRGMEPKLAATRILTQFGIVLDDNAGKRYWPPASPEHPLDRHGVQGPHESDHSDAAPVG